MADAGTEHGVPVDTRIEFNGNASRAIVEVAQRERCGLIFMGSHGQGGLSSAFLGSVAFKTLTQAHIPVMVDHPTDEEVARAEALMREHALEP